MRLIDADALIKALNLAEWFNLADFNEAVYTVRKAQPMDAVPVRHGRWDCSDDIYETAVCSVCGYDTKEPFEWVQEHITDFRFCPHCGAKIDREEGGNNAVSGCR